MAISDSAREYGQGVAGGLLFALPLLLTREVWSTGFLATPQRLLAGVAGTLGVLLLFNRIAGLRKDASWAECIVDTLEEYGIGLAVAAAVLWLTGRMTLDHGLPAIVGTLAMGAMGTSLGVSVGTAQLGENPEGAVGDGVGPQFIAALAGAVLVAGNIAPTMEVGIIASAAGPSKLLGIVVVTLVLLGLILTKLDLKGGKPFTEGFPLGRTAFDTVAVSAAAIAASAPLLWFFGRFDGEAPSMVAGQLAVMFTPAAIGAAVGKGLLQA